MTAIGNWVKGKDNPVIKQAERKAFIGKIMLDTGRVERKNVILNEYVENPRDSAEKQATEQPAKADKPTEKPVEAEKEKPTEAEKPVEKPTQTGEPPEAVKSTET